MKYVEYAVKDRVGYITLNRPDKRNALSSELVADLKEGFALAENDAAVKVIVLKANGDTFCAGADLEYLQKLQGFSYEENLKDSTSLKDLFLQIYLCKKVVVAQVQGHALAGGCGLVTVCDFIFAVPEAKFGYTEVKIGFIPAVVLVFLLRKVGELRTRHLLLSGNLILAEDAQGIGIVSSIYPQTIIEEEVRKFTYNLVNGNSYNSMKLTKEMITNVHSLSLEEALNYAAEMNATARGSEDCKKGISAFLNKEKLSW
ncbi:MAG TPA: enoyl-CoA hydratase-related protein [Cyclobacteriaceae bacterium]|nr:enoyl-CoA hydratase-related protein [Cyclobacteriaceae bacterium]